MVTINEMSNEELQAWVEKISLESFRVPFRHQATFNRRLSSTGGRYFMKSHNIEINPHQLATNGKEEVEKIIKHELCHYHLHIAGRGYRHRDADFKTCRKPLEGAVSANPCRRARPRAGVNRNHTDINYAAASAEPNICVNGK